MLAPLFVGFATELIEHSKLESENKAVEISAEFTSLHKVYLHLEAAWKPIHKKLNPCPSMYRDLQAFEANQLSRCFIIYYVHSVLGGREEIEGGIFRDVCIFGE